MRSTFLAALLVLVVTSCASVSPDRLLRLPAVTRSVVGAEPVIDKRAEFRALFCDVLRQSALAARYERCDDYLWRLRDERSRDGTVAAAASARLRAGVLLVGGAFGDCFPPASTPFADSVKRLRSADLLIDYVDVSGRSTSSRNARTIDARIAALSSEDVRPLILIGYSKGVADILEAVASDPAIAQRVSAVVSISGAVNGSPLARRYRGLYDRWLANRRFGSCPPDDGGVLDSLTPMRRLDWLAAHRLPANIRYYSLVTFTTRARLARILGHAQHVLSKIDVRNDGQLLAQDQVIPGSTLLGYANADHWAIALRLEDRFPFLAHRSVGKHPFPQYALLESILRYVLRDGRPKGQRAE